MIEKCMLQVFTLTVVIFIFTLFPDINCSVGEEKISSTYLRVLTRVKLIRENKFTNAYHPCNTWKYPKDVTQRGGLELWLI